MNKQESKYYRTACAIDVAFPGTAGTEKEFDYLTVKEICQKAGVNRSTFYLHYDTTRDLLNESIEYLSQQLLAKYPTPLTEHDLAVGDCDQLLFYTPQYTVPYLEFIKANQRAFMTAVAKQELFNTEQIFKQIFTRVLAPILTRFRVPATEQPYLIRFYMSGIHAIIIEWLKGGCTDSVDTLAVLIQRCVEQTRTVCTEPKP